MTQVSPAVSQLMIAETLIEQFDGVLDSLKDGAEELGYEGATVFIAEGNRVYPGIWEHLDEARARLGVNSSNLHLTGYDALRSRVDRQIGIWNFKSEGTKRKLTKTVQVFSWKHNAEGVAKEACQFLMDKMPEVDWHQQRQAANAEMVDLRSGSRNLKYIQIGAALAAAGVVAWLILS